MEVTMIAALRMMLVVCPGLPIKARSVRRRRQPYSAGVAN
jgi:hypothetical protein